MILIGIGANLPSHAGPPRETLRAALEAWDTNGVTVRAVSRLYRTKAWPDPADPAFVNAVARVETRLAPSALLECLLDVERAFGRKRGKANAPRTLDLDLLDYEGRVERGPPVLPHPGLADRAFVLIPLAEVAPGWRHPVTDRPVDALIAALPPSARAGVTKIS